jgi:hypothetical protein
MKKAESFGFFHFIILLQSISEFRRRLGAFLGEPLSLKIRFRRASIFENSTSTSESSNPFLACWVKN